MNFNLITFFEKKGCATNAKQKKLLRELGVPFQEVDLLTYPFTQTELQSFFGSTPVATWFNPNAPTIKNNEINIDALTADDAMTMMLKEPILIKRPLLVVKGMKIAGFDLDRIQKLLNITIETGTEDLHSCSAL